MATVEERLEKLEKMIGVEFADRKITLNDLVTANEIPGSGRYPWIISDWQIHTALDALTSNGDAPVPPVTGDFAAAVLNLFKSFGIKIGARVHAPIFIESKDGIGIYFQSDTDNTTGQRPENTTYPQLFGIALSGDGGGGLFQNIVYPEDGTPAYMPDPTRIGITWRIDRMGAMSINIMEAGPEFAPGRFTPITSSLGQRFVFNVQMNGDMIFRMPQENSALYVEQGFGGNPDHKDEAGNLNGHRETKFRRRVALEGGWE